MRATPAAWFALLTGIALVGFNLGGSRRADEARAAMPASDVASRVDRLLTTELFAPKPEKGAAASTATSTASAGGASTTSVTASKMEKNALAKPADDETFLRRVSLDLTGELPTLNQMTAYALDPAKDKRAKVVNQLLAEDKFGQNWGRYWRDVIMYRRTEDRALISAPALEQYLKDEFNKGTGWDKIATELLTATGNVQENGRTAILMAQQGEAEETAAEVSRIFLGIQIQCAQCHDHPTDKWKRQTFHELAAFFPRIAVRRVDDGDKRGFEVVSVNRDRPGKAGGGPRKGSTEHYMPDLKDPSAKGTLIQPKFFVNQQTLTPGLTDLDRRETLAKWMTSQDNPWFAKAFVNRVWSEMVGEGFYEPVDDMGPERHPTAPKTLDLLSREFASSGYDIKWLFRTITATEAYQRASRSRRNIDETPFTASCPQRLRADQLYDAILSALGIAEPTGRGGEGKGPYARIGGPRQQFAQAFGYDPSDPREEVQGGIPQALVMMNSSLVNNAINAGNSRSVLGKLLADTKDNEQAVAELYLRCLAREPSKSEKKAALEHIQSVKSRNEAFEDLLWVLMNSTEFLHRR